MQTRSSSRNLVNPVYAPASRQLTPAQEERRARQQDTRTASFQEDARQARALATQARAAAESAPRNQRRELERIAVRRESEAASSELLARASETRRTLGRNVPIDSYRQVMSSILPQDRIDRLNASIISRISSANIGASSSAPRAARARSAALQNALTARETRRDRILQNRTIIEQQISSLYQMNNDIEACLTDIQRSYFTTIDDTRNIDYHYRTTELSFIEYIEILEEFRNDILTLPRDAQVATRYNISSNEDIQKYTELKTLIKTFNDEIAKYNNKQVITDHIISQRRHYITQEVMHLNTIIGNLQGHISNPNLDPGVLLNINNFIDILNARKNALDTIMADQTILQEITEEIDVKRLRIVKIIEALNKTAQIIEILLMSILRIEFQTIETKLDDAINKIKQLLIPAGETIDYRDISDLLSRLKQEGFYTGQIIGLSIYEAYSPHATQFNSRTFFSLRSLYLRRLSEIRRINAIEARRVATLARRNAATEARRALIAARRATARPAGISTAATRQPILTTSLLNLKKDSVKTEEAIKTQCETTFINFETGEYKNILKDKCIKYNRILSDKNEVSENFTKLKEHFKLKFDNRYGGVDRTYRPPTVTNYVKNSIASLFGRYLKYNNLCFNDTGLYFIVNRLLTKKDDGSFEEEQQSGIDAGGLRRDFVSALTTELFEKNIFISREGTKKYFINPKFEPDEFFIYIVKKISSDQSFNFEEQDYYIKFYYFIGVLLSFILVNECGIEHYLSSYIMANFINNDHLQLDDLDYVYFMKDDFPEFATSLINLLDPGQRDNIEYTYIKGFNVESELSFVKID